MRRLLNFLLLLVLVASVGYLLYRAKLLPGRSTPTPAPAVTPEPARDSLRVSVSHRPEAVLLGALKRLLEAENLKIEVLPFDPETSWIELAAGELDLVVAPIGEAVTAQARFQAGRFLFVSGLSEGYDLILAGPNLSGVPKTVGITAGQGGELFALQKFPGARLVSADDQGQLQMWLGQGAIQAALLESASLSQRDQSFKRLGTTSLEGPLPSVVVLSRTLAEESSSNGRRIAILLKALESWSGLIGYLATQPELLRSTLKQDAEELGINLDTLLRDYRFLTPNAGRDLLLESYDDGLFKETLDLLVLAGIRNLTAPDWSVVLDLPPYLATSLPGETTAATTAATTASPTPMLVSPTPRLSPTPLDTPTTSVAEPGSNTFTGAAPPDAWPDPVATVRVSSPLEFGPALTDGLVGIATSKGLEAYTPSGELAFSSVEGGPPVAAPLADAQKFYVLRAGALEALDGQGKVVWTYPLEGTPGPQTLLTPGEVVFTLQSKDEHQVVAVSRDEGKLTWNAGLSDPPAAGPVFANQQQQVVLTDEKGNLHAWKAQTGSAAWQNSIDKPTFLAPASESGEMAVTDPDGAVRLLTLSDGSGVWETNLGTPLACGPTLTASLVLVPAKDTYLYGLDRRNGEIRHKIRLSVPLSQPALVVGDHVYCSDEMGGVHALTLPALDLKWSKSLAKSDLRGPIFSTTHWSLLAADGTLLIYQR